MSIQHELKDYKLVRDKIVEITDQPERFTTIRNLFEGLDVDTQWVKVQLLKRKATEEATEVLMTSNNEDLVEEMADLLEVMDQLIVETGITWKDIHDAQNRKAAKRGGFSFDWIYYTKHPHKL